MPGRPGARPRPAAFHPMKKQIRSDVRRRILAMDRQARLRAEGVLGDLVARIADGFGAGFVLGYLALADEARIDGALAVQVAAGRRVLLPVSTPGGLRFGAWSPLQPLAPDHEGVLAPEAGGTEGLPAGRGILLVPGRAFDAAGHRLGRGGGYYDRLLARLQEAGRGRELLVLGIAYGCQLVDAVPVEQHDRSVDLVVTESGLVGPGAGEWAERIRTASGQESREQEGGSR